MVVRVKWFYHPEETQGCPNLKYPVRFCDPNLMKIPFSLQIYVGLFKIFSSHPQGALFESPHEDENDVQTISHKCEVLELDPYVKKFGNDPRHYESIYDNNDTYYLAGHYDPTLYHIKMQPEIPILPDNQKWV